MSSVKSEDRALYAVDGREAEDELILQAIEIIQSRLQRGETLEKPADSINYVKVLLGEYEHEVFSMITLDNRNRVIAWHEMFRGTIDGASVYPREVLKQALADNAAAVIFAHNHPSGVAEPSQADIRITERLRSALQLVDIRTLDHIIVGGADHTSLANRGLI